MMAQTAAALADAIIAKWQADEPAAKAAYAARAADRRLQFLDRLLEELRAPSVSSFDGVIANLVSARAARRKRVGKLWMARSRQLSTRHPTPRQASIDWSPTIRVFLLDAMVWRIAEKSRAETESMRAEFDRIEEMAS